MTVYRRLTAGACLTAVVLLSACSSSPPGEVSKSELAETRAGYAKLHTGMTRDAALATFPKANKVKLGSANVGGATIEEWKVEAFYDDKDRKDLFVTFLYFLDGKLVDSSDTRIAFRENPELVDRWKATK
jgi:hypothetical protein